MQQYGTHRRWILEALPTLIHPPTTRRNHLKLHPGSASFLLKCLHGTHHRRSHPFNNSRLFQGHKCRRILRASFLRRHRRRLLGGRAYQTLTARHGVSAALSITTHRTLHHCRHRNSTTVVTLARLRLRCSLLRARHGRSSSLRSLLQGVRQRQRCQQVVEVPTLCRRPRALTTHRSSEHRRCSLRQPLALRHRQLHPSTLTQSTLLTPRLRSSSLATSTQ